MSDDLERRLAALRERPAPDRLTGLEAQMWAQVEHQNAVAQADTWRWRAGVAALMLAIGAMAGGATARSTSEQSPFAVHAQFAPSTLLEQR